MISYWLFDYELKINWSAQSWLVYSLAFKETKRKKELGNKYGSFFLISVGQILPERETKLWKQIKSVGGVVMRYITFYAGLEPNPWLIPWER